MLLALAQAGIRVPDEVSVVGYDDQFGLASLVRPALTTVRLPYLEMGRAAAEQLLQTGCHPASPGAVFHAAPTGPWWLPCPAVVRDSLGPPRTSP